MKKTIMISGTALLALLFTGCSDVAAPAPTYSKAKAERKAHVAKNEFQNQGQMINYCRGMIAEKAGTKPMYVQMGRVEIEQGARPASSIPGTVDGKKYTCLFDTEGKYVDTVDY